ncbi:MAG: hypothetical protein JNG84_10240 [Archangium sp.]|nr:hypothetical protein [Archangium sp.]
MLQLLGKSRRFYGKAIMAIAFGVSFVAAAQTSANALGVPSGVSANGPVDDSVLHRFRGSAIAYSHQATAFTFSPSAQPWYNPTWTHRISLLPEYHFNERVFVRARLFISQEFTQSDTLNNANEVELSDLWFDVGTPGWVEPNSKIRVSGDLRVNLPLSKIAQLQTRVLTLAPSLALSRVFAVKSGLVVAYAGRFGYRFNRFTSPQNQGPGIAACGDPRALECAEYISTGTRNTNFDLIHGPTVSFSPTDALNVSASYLMASFWLHPLSRTPDSLNGLDTLSTANDVGMRTAALFSLSASWQINKQVSLTAGSWTFSSQLGADGRYLFPLFNRDTTLFIEAGVDIEQTIAALLPKKS